MKLGRAVAVVAISAIGLVVAAAVIVDPRALLLPAWLLSEPWKGTCQKDAVAAYLGGHYAPCEGSPLTPQNVNTPLKESGYCPLEYAALHAQVEAVEELLAKGANPKLCSGYPMRLFQFAVGSSCRSSATSAQRLLDAYGRAQIQPDDPQTLLFHAARGRCEPGIRLAVTLGASVNAEDSSGKTPLHYVVGGSPESLRLSVLLVSLGADAQLPVSSGETALAQAKRLNGEGAWPAIETALSPAPSR